MSKTFRMSRLLPVAWLLAGALGGAVQAQAQADAAPAPTVREADFIVAVVNTEPITNHEVRARTARALRELEQRGVPPPPTGELRREMLDRLVAERAQLQYARDIGIRVDDTVLTQAELSVARQNGLDSVEALHRRIEQEGIAVRDFRDDLRNQVLLARLREREIEPQLQVSEAEVESFIREQTGAPVGTPEINLAMILVAVPENASQAQVEPLRQRAADVAARARKGEDFAELAVAYSDALQGGRDGGVLGLRPVEGYPELFVQSTQRARLGEIVGPIRSDAGFHVLKVLERRVNTELPEVIVPQTRVRHILLQTGPSQSEAVARERLADFRRRMVDGQATFEQLAREHSQDDSAADGGDLGWANPGQFVPEFEQAMNSLGVGQVSEPFSSRFGVHLVRVDERREQVLSGAEQRELARGMLREQKAQEAFETWAQEVQGRAYVEYRDPPR